MDVTGTTIGKGFQVCHCRCCQITLISRCVDQLLGPCHLAIYQFLTDSLCVSPGCHEALWLCGRPSVARQQQSAQAAGIHWRLPGPRQGVAGHPHARPHGRQAPHAAVRLGVQGKDACVFSGQLHDCVACDRPAYRWCSSHKNWFICEVHGHFHVYTHMMVLTCRLTPTAIWCTSRGRCPGTRATGCMCAMRCTRPQQTSRHCRGPQQQRTSQLCRQHRQTERILSDSEGAVTSGWRSVICMLILRLA